MTSPGEADLRLGVIGLGNRSHIAGLAHRPGNGSRVTAVCDLDPARTDAAVERYGPGVTGYGDYRQMLACEPLDAVMVITPDDTHEEVGVVALHHGLAVYMEKPLAITTSGADRLLRETRRLNGSLYVGHNMRHMPVVEVMKKLIDDGVIGDVKVVWCRHFVGHGGDYYFKDWHADRRRTTGLLLQKGAHDLDVIHWLAGGSSQVVTAMGGLLVYGGTTERRDRSGDLMNDWFDEENWPPAQVGALAPRVDVEDLSMVHMTLDNGVYASYEQCHFTPDYWRNYTVIGTEGRLENFGDTDEGAVVKVWRRRSGYRSEADLEVAVSVGEGTHGGADHAIIEEFLAYVRDPAAETVTTSLAARNAVATSFAATQSLRAGGSPITVPPYAAAPPAPPGGRSADPSHRSRHPSK